MEYCVLIRDMNIIINLKFNNIIHKRNNFFFQQPLVFIMAEYTYIFEKLFRASFPTIFPPVELYYIPANITFPYDSIPCNKINRNQDIRIGSMSLTQINRCPTCDNISITSVYLPDAHFMICKCDEVNCSNFDVQWRICVLCNNSKPLYTNTSYWYHRHKNKNHTLLVAQCNVTKLLPNDGNDKALNSKNEWSNSGSLVNNSVISMLVTSEHHLVPESIDHNNDNCVIAFDEHNYSDMEHSDSTESTCNKISNMMEWNNVFFQTAVSPTNFTELFQDQNREGDVSKNKMQPLSSLYYERQHIGELGAQSIIAKAIHNTSDLNTCRRISDEESCFLLQYSRLCSNLKTKDTALLFSILNFMVNHPDSNYVKNLPITVEKVRRQITEGTNSIQQLMPRPPVQVLKGGFVYISIIEILRFMMGQGSNVEPLVDLPGLFHGNTEKGKEITQFNSVSDEYVWKGDYHNKYFLLLELLIWSDAYNPLNTKKTWILPHYNGIDRYST
jgi:hypothetical protein